MSSYSLCGLTYEVAQYDHLSTNGVENKILKYLTKQQLQKMYFKWTFGKTIELRFKE